MSDLSVSRARLQLIIAMVLFSSIGIFVRFIPLPSSIIAFCRAVIASIFLCAFVTLTHQAIDWQRVHANLRMLVLSGLAIAVNWILLFEAFKLTTVAIAILCYYLAPIVVILAAPIVFHERLTLKKTLCVLTALIGMFLVTGVVEAGLDAISGSIGIIFALAAAVLYAIVILLNKKLTDVSAYDKTIIQMVCAAILLLPYTLVMDEWTGTTWPMMTIVLLFVVGIVHTGITYTLFFGSMTHLNAQTVAIFSYLDPILAVILSAIVLNEPLGFYGIIGAVLILGSTLVSELEI